MRFKKKSVNVKPEGVDTVAYMGHLTSISLPTLGPGSQGGDVCFLARRNGTKWHCSMCLSVSWPPWN